MGPLPAGRWAATVHLIGWDDKPGAKVAGLPGPNALPDFVLLLNPAESDQSFRHEGVTFTSA